MTVAQESFWVARNEPSALAADEPLPDATFDVAVIGAGVVGTTLALRLARSGRRVVLVEAERAAAYGVTGQATAKVTVGMGLRAAEVARMHGDDTALELLGAAVVGCSEVRARVDELGNAGAHIAAHVVYASDPADADALDRTAAISGRAGVRVIDVEPADASPAAVAAITFPDQLMIDPVRYTRGLLALATAVGCVVVARAPMRSFDAGDPHRVVTDRGDIRAHDVVLATHVPVLNRTLGFAAVIQRRHFAVAGVVDRPVRMTYDVSGRRMSSRPVGGGSSREAVAVGASIDTGHGSEPEAMHAVYTWAETTLGMTVTHEWSSQDARAVDGLPLVGPSMGTPRLWFATGFDGWGFTLGTAAALDLAARLAGREPLFPTWTPSRGSIAHGLGDLATNLARTAKGFAIDPLTTPMRSLADTISELGPGQGTVIRDEHGPCAVCRDADGNVHAVSPRCPHLGCFVRWDAQAQSWDCPCHGSRFAPDGAVLHGPATKPLDQRAV